MARKVLVTGGAGFVGSHLVDALLEAGHEVRVLDNLSPQVHGETLPDYLSSDAELMRGDMQDSASVRAAMEGIEVVFHLAAAVGVGQSMYEISHYMGANTPGHGGAPAGNSQSQVKGARSWCLLLPCPSTEKANTFVLIAVKWLPIFVHRNS